MKFIVNIIIIVGLLSELSMAHARADRKLLIEQCQACHNATEQNLSTKYPQLAGQHESYLYKQLIDFRQGKNGGRNNSIMTGIAASLTQSELISLAAYFSQQQGNTSKTQLRYLVLGRKLYQGGDITRHIPACSACHGPSGAGNPDAGFPAVSGQSAQYIINQLQAFKDQRRRNDPNQMMRTISAKLSDQDMVAVASYMAGLYGNGG